MIDLESERLMGLADAARMLPGRDGRAVHPATLTRWIAKGAKGPDGGRVRLEAVRVGGRWVTSAEAVQRFVEALTPTPEAVAAESSRGSATAPTTPRPSATGRRREPEWARRILDGAGL
jgi:hypothetical protein